MPTKTVPFAPPIDQMQLGTIRAAWPVEAAPIKAAGSVANWLIGKGHSLVVDGGRAVGVTRYEARYWCEPSSVHGSLCWILTLSARDTLGQDRTFPVLIDLTLAGLTRAVSLGSTPTTYYFPIANAGPGEYGISLDPYLNGEADLLCIHALQLVEVPRTTLDASGPGCKLVQPRSQIYDGYGGYDSISGVMHAHEVLKTSRHHRGALFSWSSNHQLQTANTATYAAMFLGLRPELQTRYMFGPPGATTVTRAMKVSVRAHQVGGTTGNVRLSMTNGGSAVLTFAASASPTWVHGTLPVRTDNYVTWATDGGRRGDADLMLIEARVNGGGELHPYSICVSDVPGA